MNKKEIIIKVLRILLGIGIVITVLLFLAYSETHYTRTGFVKKKPLSIDEYYFYDSKGNIWEFLADEKLNSDMNIEVKMFNNCTMDNIKDDMIIDYQILSEPEIKIEIEK